MRFKFLLFLYWTFSPAGPLPDKTINTGLAHTPNIRRNEIENTPVMTDKQYTYLALGDSYTIGTGVSIYETYPYQAVQRLRKAGHAFCAPEIIARNGWTTGELSEGINATHFLPSYDFVSILIGVNNEYRGRSSREYEKEFEALLKQALHFAGDRPERVFVLSIPDWSVTPFGQNDLPDAKGRDQKKVADEIDAFNGINRNIADRYKVNYINITPHTKIAGTDPSSLATDFLHPSGKEYGNWAETLSKGILSKLGATENL